MAVVMERIRTAVPVLEAGAWLALAAAAVRVLGFRRLHPLLGTPHRRTPEHAPASDTRAAADVRRAIRAVVRRMPRRVRCLERSLAAYGMLRRRGVEGTLYFGVAKSAGGPVGAHAWVRVGDYVVVGRKHADVTPVMTFAGRSAADAPGPP